MNKLAAKLKENRKVAIEKALIIGGTIVGIIVAVVLIDKYAKADEHPVILGEPPLEALEELPEAA